LCEGVEDLVGGLGPGEWLWVVVPVLDPGADVVFEVGDGGVDAAADELLGD
jgi:hypothetical protein